VRPLSAEVLADALADVTDVPDQFGNLPKGTRAVSLHDPSLPSETLETLGRCARDASCDGIRGQEPGLPEMLHRLNGPLINGKLKDPDGRLVRLRTEGQDSWTILEEFYVRALGRPPMASEQSFWQSQLDDASDGAERAAILEDVVWGLLNCREFRTNH
jgi:hypothetical protein